MTVLIVYENVPETTDLYIEEVSDKDWVWMQKCHRKYLNTQLSVSVEKACDKLCKWIEGKKKLDDKGPIATRIGRPFEYVLLTGFMM